MGTMAEMAVEYRKESARIAMRIKEKEESGAPRWEIEELKRMLREMRDKQRLLASYYDTPRDMSITMACAYAPKRKGDGS